MERLLWVQGAGSDRARMEDSRGLVKLVMGVEVLATWTPSSRGWESPLRGCCAAWGPWGMGSPGIFKL